MNDPIDLERGGEGQLWEMKNVGDERHSIKGTMRNAYHKWLRLGLDADADARVVVTSYGASRGSVASLALWNVTCGCLSPESHPQNRTYVRRPVK